MLFKHPLERQLRDQQTELDIKRNEVRNLRADLSAAPAGGRVLWRETFALNESGHIWVRAQTGYGNNDETGYWLDDFLEPGQRVEVIVRTKEGPPSADEE